MNKRNVKTYYPIIPLTCALLYITQGMIIPEGSIVSRALLVVYLLFAFSHFAIVGINYRSKIVSAITLFLFLQFIYFLFGEQYYIRMDGEWMYSLGNMIAIIFTFSLFYEFYYYSLKGKLSEKQLVIYVIVFIILSIPRYFYTEMKMIEAMFLKGWNVEDVTNNTAYYFLEAFAFIPLIYKKKKLSLAIIATSGFFILLSAKRGAILIFAVCLLFYLPFFLKNNKRISLLLIPVIVVMGIIAFNYFSHDAYLLERLMKTTEGYSSGRDDIYGSIINYCLYDHFSIDTFLFGYGFNYSIKIAGNVAHNDWLELLSCSGLLGITVYLSIYILLMLELKKIRNNAYKRTMTLCLVVLFLRTFFSASYTSTVLIFSIIGFILGSEKRNCIYENFSRRRLLPERKGEQFNK